jgi:signal transduction histidine kinase
MKKTIWKVSGSSPEGEAAARGATDIGEHVPDRPALTRQQARELSHELRTPLTAMTGWLHLMETGALDDAGYKRAIAKLRANLDAQLRTIEKYLGNTQEERH